MAPNPTPQNTYSYIDTQGNRQQVQADSPEHAISIAPNRASDSGVQLFTPPAPNPTPAPAPAPAELPRISPSTPTPAPAPAPEQPAAPVPVNKFAEQDSQYEHLLTQNRGLIDSINKGYQSELDVGKATANARVNAGGLAGSSAGGTITEKEMAPIIAARDKELNTVYSNLNNIALAETDKARATGLDSIKALAANHTDWNKFKSTNPEGYKNLVSALGGDPNVADAMFAMSIPTNVIDNTFNTSDGNGGTIVTQISHDPITNKPSVQKYTLPGVSLPQNWTSEKFGTNAMIYKSPNFDPHDPSTYVTISSDPTNSGALTVTKDGITTVNGIPINQTPGISEGAAVAGAAPGIATIIGLQDPSLPLADVANDPSIGVEGIVAGIMKNEGGSPKGVVNNPGNIKFVGLPGQKDSGIKATDGGTFASYDTPQAGKTAIGDLVNKGIAAGKNFDEFINSYTGTGGPAKPSGSILTETGLSLPAFNFLTQGTASMTRMSASQRKQIMAEAEAFLNAKGLDVSTFQSQYKAYNDVLQKNISRNAQVKIMENELAGTVENLLSVVDQQELGKLNVKNVADIWAGKQVNDPLAQQYAFHFQQLKNELAGYFAASQGKSSPDVIDNEDAAKAVINGMSTGSLQGFKDSVENSTSKMGTVLQKSVDDAQKSVWNLFGVADKYRTAGQKDSDSKAKGNMSDSDYVEKSLSSLGLKYEDLLAQMKGKAPDIIHTIPAIDNKTGQPVFASHDEIISGEYTYL